MEGHTTVGEQDPRRHLADVVEQRGPAHRWRRHGLSHHLLGVLPDVLVAPACLLRKIHRGFQFGQHDLQDAAFVQPLEAQIQAATHDHRLEPGAQPDRIHLDQRGSRVAGRRGDLRIRQDALGRHQTGNLQQRVRAAPEQPCRGSKRSHFFQ